MTSSQDEFTIHVEGKTIICDKTILREGSEYFRAMFDSNMIESKSNETTLQEQSYDIVKTLIHSLKTGELEIGDNVEELVEGAVMLQMESAIKTCTAYLEKTLDDTNCFSLLKLAETFGLDKLYNVSKRHSLYYFNKVVKHEEFQNLTHVELIDYLSERHLNVENELNVLDAIDSWVNSNTANERTASLAAILECFHPEDLMEGEWEEAVKKSILTETEAGKQWLISHSKPSSTTGEQYRELPVMFLTVGGILPGCQCAELDEPVSDICRFDEDKKCFKEYRSLHEIYKELGDKMGYSICTFGRYMYISGGQVDLLRQTYETKVWRFDSFTEKWEHLTDLLSCRRHHGSCASEGSYYVLGGFGKFRKCLNTFEEYDIEKDYWFSHKDMPNPLFGMEVAKTKDKLFAFKGYSYCYDFVTKSWAELNCPETGQLYPICFNKYLYVFPKDERWTLQLIIEEPPEHTKLRQVLRTPLDDGKRFETVVVSEKFSANSTNIVAVGKKFFYIQRIHYGERDVFRASEDYTFQFVSGLFDNFQQVLEMGDNYDTSTELTNLVALPSYPMFKCAPVSVPKNKTCS